MNSTEKPSPTAPSADEAFSRGRRWNRPSAPTEARNLATPAARVVCGRFLDTARVGAADN